MRSEEKSLFKSRPELLRDVIDEAFLQRRKPFTVLTFRGWLRNLQPRARLIATPNNFAES